MKHINRIEIDLSDFAKVQSDAAKHFARAQACSIMNRSAFADLLYAGYVPPTKWQKRGARIRAFFGRFVIAFRVIRGDDIHEDCGY